MSRLIDADALMEASMYEFWQDGSAITPIGEHILAKFRKLVRSMPTIEPEPKWIPCSERLPEVDDRYLVAVNYYGEDVITDISTFAKNLYSIDKYDFPDKKGKSGWYDYDSEYGYYERRNVIAWMPLPEQYKK